MPKTPPKKYRIFPAYINSDGFVVPEGEYFEYEINLDEARKNSTAVLLNASDFSSTKDLTAIPEKLLNEGLSNVDRTLTTEITKPEVKKLKINTCIPKEIEDLKFVGKVAAQKISEFRKNAKIETYAQLDKIAPIKGNKNWEDIVVIDFELPSESSNGLVYEGLKTFGYRADNITTNATTQPTPN